MFIFHSIISNGKDNNLILSDAASVNLYDIEKKERKLLYQAGQGARITKSELDPHHPDLVFCIDKL